MREVRVAVVSAGESRDWFGREFVESDARQGAIDLVRGEFLRAQSDEFGHGDVGKGPRVLPENSDLPSPVASAHRADVFTVDRDGAGEGRMVSGKEAQES